MPEVKKREIQAAKVRRSQVSMKPSSLAFMISHRTIFYRCMWIFRFTNQINMCGAFDDVLLYLSSCAFLTFSFAFCFDNNTIIFKGKTIFTRVGVSLQKNQNFPLLQQIEYKLCAPHWWTSDLVTTGSLHVNLLFLYCVIHIYVHLKPGS